MAITVGITDLDRLSVAKLEKMIKSFEGKLADPMLSETTRSTVEKLKKKYENQRNKTLNIYNKNKNRKIHKNKLIGISKSYLSVAKIYEIMGKKTKDMSGQWKSLQWLNEHPVENALIIGGSGLAIVGFLGTNPGKKALEEIWNAIKWAYPDWKVGLVTSGLLFASAGIAAKKIRKMNEAKAAALAEAEEKANEGTEKDAKYLKNPDNLAKLAEEAMNDPTVKEYLEILVNNPYADMRQKEAASKVLTEVNKKISDASEKNKEFAQEAAKLKVNEILASESKLVNITYIAKKTKYEVSNDTHGPSINDAIDIYLKYTRFKTLGVGGPSRDGTLSGAPAALDRMKKEEPDLSSAISDYNTKKDAFENSTKVNVPDRILPDMEKTVDINKNGYNNVINNIKKCIITPENLKTVALECDSYTKFSFKVGIDSISNVTCQETAQHYAGDVYLKKVKPAHDFYSQNDPIALNNLIEKIKEFAVLDLKEDSHIPTIRSYVSGKEFNEFFEDMLKKVGLQEYANTPYFIKIKEIAEKVFASQKENVEYKDLGKLKSYEDKLFTDVEASDGITKNYERAILTIGYKLGLINEEDFYKVLQPGEDDVKKREIKEKKTALINKIKTTLNIKNDADLQNLLKNAKNPMGKEMV